MNSTPSFFSKSLPRATKSGNVRLNTEFSDFHVHLYL